MTIQPNTPLESAVQLDAKKPAQQRNVNNPAPNDQSPESEALNAFSMDATESSSALDSTGADQLLQSLVQSMSGNFNSAVTAHAGLNATSVFDLIQ